MSAPRALLSVYDKTGIVEFASVLVALGYELLSSGGTAKALQEAGIPVTEVAIYTGYPEMPGGLVKTLHPKIHAGLLADEGNEMHLSYLVKIGAELIDLVVVNLYPFTSKPSTDMIDIGGPTMIRAGAKNHARVGVVVDPADYQSVIDELQEKAELSDAFRLNLARKAFAHTASYDAPIVGWLDKLIGSDELPPTIHLALVRSGDQLRYGENPHQKGAVYQPADSPRWWTGVQQLQGRVMSYLNWNDLEAAAALASSLHEASGGKPAVAIIKHANPCGAAVADNLADAYHRAYEVDEDSAFGGIVAFSQEVDVATAERMAEAAQADVVIAPSYAEGVLDILYAKRKNTRVLAGTYEPSGTLMVRDLDGGYLVQERPRFDADPEKWEVMTERQPTEDEMADAVIAWRIAALTKSNCVALVFEGQAVGIGAGEQSRVGAARIAVAKAGDSASGSVSATDGFYPFPDGVEVAAKAGVTVVVHPGGSDNDQNVIERANELGITLIKTGERQFNH